MKYITAGYLFVSAFTLLLVWLWKPTHRPLVRSQLTLQSFNHLTWRPTGGAYRALLHSERLTRVISVSLSPSLHLTSSVFPSGCKGAHVGLSGQRPGEEFTPGWPDVNSASVFMSCAEVHWAVRLLGESRQMDPADQHLQTNHRLGGPGVICLCMCACVCSWVHMCRLSDERLMDISFIKTKLDGDDRAQGHSLRCRSSLSPGVFY